MASKKTSTRSVLRKFGGSKTSKITRGKYYVKTVYKELSKPNYKMTPARVRYRLRLKEKTGEIKKGKLKKAMVGAGVHSFPGYIKNSIRSGYADGTIGLFTQSIKGMKGINFVENAIKQTEVEFAGMENE